MADRYWVGGTAAWDATAGTKWALTSGGAGGQAVPTAADDVFFDAASGTVTVTVSATANCLNFNCTGFTGTITGTSTINVYANVIRSASMTWNHTGNFTLAASSGSYAITSAGKSFGAGLLLGLTGAGSATWTLQDALVVVGNITLTNGTFTTNNFNITAGGIQSNVTNARTINLGSSTVTLTGTGPWSTSTNTNLTFNAGTSSIICTGTSPSFSAGDATTGLIFYNVSFTNTGTNQFGISGVNTFNNLLFTAPASAGVRNVTFNHPTIINGTLSTSGTAGNRRLWFSGPIYGIAQTLTINSTPSLTDADFRDMYVIGTAAPVSGTRIGDLRGCRGITFSTPKTVYWNLAGAQNWSANGWSNTSTGTPSTDFFPLAQDTATFTNAGSVTDTITVNAAVPYTGTVDMSGRTNAMTLNFGTLAVYGNWLNGSGTIVSSGTSLTFSGRNTQTITSLGKVFGGSITVDSYGGVVELADALNIASTSLTVTNGTFDTKGYAVTAGRLNSNNSNVRGINLGSSTVILSATGVVLDLSTITNLTFNAGTSQITMSSSSSDITVDGGGLVFYNVSFTGTAAFLRNVLGTNTFNNLSITAPASAGLTVLQFVNNQIINGTLTVAGATPTRRIFVRSNTLGTPRTLTVGTLSATDCDFRDIVITGAAAGSSQTRAGDCGGNSGIVFSAAKTVYWNLSGTQNWSAVGWAASSGGTPSINNFPLAQDTAKFDDAGAAGTVTADASWALPTIDMLSRTSAMSFSIGTNNPIYIYGDLILGAGVTTVDTSGILRFSKRGTSTISCNGIVINFDTYIDNINGITQLGSAFVSATQRAIGLTSGTFDAVSYNVTAGLCTISGSTARTLKMGSGTWTLSSAFSQSVWNALTTANLVFYKGTANIVLSDTGTTARTFAGGGLSYNKLTIGGTTGISTTTISGNNQFTELASTKTVAHTINFGSTTQTFGKWTITGTFGNVVTLSSSGGGHVIAGAAVTGVDYLAMGTNAISATSPGEFYAGTNSTGTGGPVFLTPNLPSGIRYWVGGSGTWNETNTTNWSTTSGGPGGASVPRSTNGVVFNAASSATSYTVTCTATQLRCGSLSFAAPASGTVTWAGTAPITIHELSPGLLLPATGLTVTYTGLITLSGSFGYTTVTTNGVALNSNIIINGVGVYWGLGSALNIGTNSITVTNGILETNNYTVAANSLLSNNLHSRSFLLGSSTLTLSGSTPIDFGTTETNRASFAFNRGTSQINCSAGSTTFTGNNLTFYNVSFTSSNAGNITINNANTFNNLTVAGSSGSAILKNILFSANQAISGTLTFSASTNPTSRHFVQSAVLGTPRTLTCANFSGVDVDFRDIVIAGAAAPVSGTRLGDCKGNNGITFDAPKTVYWNLVGNNNWSATAWAASAGATPAVNNFPLAQDTAVFTAASPASGATTTINAAYNIGTIDMSARTANTMTLATGSQSPTIYGNWINGTGTTLTGTGTLTFAGRGTQTITSAGKPFLHVTIETPSGTVSLMDALTMTGRVLFLTSGSLLTNGYVVSANEFKSQSNNIREINFGGSILSTTDAPNVWAVAPTNLTVTGTGTISLTSASAKTFAGGGVSYAGITLNQGGAGTLTITGNNTFADITNTYSATGATTIALGNTTQRVGKFSASGAVGKVLTVTGTSASSPATLIYTGAGEATAATTDYLNVIGVRAYNLANTWKAGANSTNGGSLGWIFAAGTVVALAASTFFLMF